MITLSTGIIALTVTLLKDVVRTPAAGTMLLKFAWVFFGFAVVCGMWFLLALTGSIADKGKITDTDLSINKPNALWPMRGQVASFGIGLVLTILFGVRGLGQTNSGQPMRPLGSASSVTKIISIGPFVDADTILASGNWSGVEGAVRAALRLRNPQVVVDGLLLSGGVDQRTISPVAMARFPSNEALANARAEAVRARLQKVVGNTIGVFTIAAGALEVGRSARAEALSRDRRVDVFLLSRSAIVPQGAR